MLSNLSADAIQTNINKENPEEQELFQTSKRKSDFSKSFDYSIPSFGNTKADLSLNRISYLNDNCLVNTKNNYPSICINQKIMEINKIINDHQEEKMFLHKKKNIHFNIENL